MSKRMRQAWSNFVVQLANRFPFVRPVRRLTLAVYDSMANKRSYSQYGEDVWLLSHLAEYSTQDAIYVDVGAHHPTRISNTYLLYRAGHRGVLIEPNRELLGLHRMFRRRDITISVGCGATPSLGAFHVSDTSVLSAFARTGDEQHGSTAPRTLRVEFVPVLPLDEILSKIEFRWVSILSIDTEGMDHEVLAGAAETLNRTLFVCVEVNDVQAEQRITAMLSGSFQLEQRVFCNLIWRNTASRDAPWLEATSSPRAPDRSTAIH
jgi:FkbM family methyltransferase